MRDSPGEKVLQAIAVTAELTGTMLSEAAARVLLSDLTEFTDDELLVALTRCRKELRGRLTVAEIISRVPGGHPSPDEAWSLVQRALGDERETLIVTAPMLAGLMAADRLADNKIAARMAFLEVYERFVGYEGPRPKWQVMAGWDAKRRAEVVEEAVVQGRISMQDAARHLPNLNTSQGVLDMLKVKSIAEAGK